MSLMRESWGRYLEGKEKGFPDPVNTSGEPPGLIGEHISDLTSLFSDPLCDSDNPTI